MCSRCALLAYPPTAATQHFYHERSSSLYVIFAFRHAELSNGLIFSMCARLVIPPTAITANPAKNANPRTHRGNSPNANPLKRRVAPPTASAILSQPTKLPCLINFISSLRSPLDKDRAPLLVPYFALSLVSQFSVATSCFRFAWPIIVMRPATRSEAVTCKPVKQQARHTPRPIASAKEDVLQHHVRNEAHQRSED